MQAIFPHLVKTTEPSSDKLPESDIETKMQK